MSRSAYPFVFALAALGSWAYGQCQWSAVPTPAGFLPRGLMEAPFGGSDSLVVSSLFHPTVAVFDGQQWTDLDAGYLSVNGLAWFDRGDGATLYAGGSADAFAQVKRWNGMAWQMVAQNYYAQGYPGGVPGHMVYGMKHIKTVRAMAVFDDGAGARLYVAGSSGPDGYTSLYRYAPWGAFGGAITRVGLSPHVESLAVYDDGGGPALYVLGGFTHAAGVPAPNLARFDGKGWSAVGGGSFVPPEYGRMLVLDDGSGPALYVGAMRWDGQSWTNVGKVPLASYEGATGAAGAALYTFGAASTERRVGRVWTAVGGGVTGSIGYFTDVVGGLGLTPAAGAHGLYVVGDFTHAGGVLSPGVARLSCGVACYADCNASGSLTVADFGCFQTRFVGGDPYADCNASGSLTVADFGCFQTSFVGGCP